MWERFSFYGMQALLMLYMTKYLLLPEHARNVFGLAQYRSGLATLVGPMTDLAFAAQTFGIYSGLLYGAPLIGARRRVPGVRQWVLFNFPDHGGFRDHE